MRVVAVLSSLLLCAAVAWAAQINVEKRNTDEELAHLLAALQNSVRAGPGPAGPAPGPAGPGAPGGEDGAESRKHHKPKPDDDGSDRSNDVDLERENFMRDFSQFNEEYELRDGQFVKTRGFGLEERKDLQKTNGVSDAMKKEIVDLHNKLRKKQGAANMEMLKYNPKLAALAQTWSQKCSYGHGQPPFDANSLGFKDMKEPRQSIALFTDNPFSATHDVMAWYNEIKDYHYSDTAGSCSGTTCGHYTASVYRKSTDIGCGVTFCPSISGYKDAHYFVCNYAPTGFDVETTPFTKGEACTKCDRGIFFCNDGLCDSTCKAASATCQCKAKCQKGGKQTKDCKCECTGGASGPDCSEQCADKDSKCGVNGGYPEFMCTMGFVKEKCPKLCKVCKSKREDTSEDKSMLKRLMMEYLLKED